jgi:hypothetical protein
MTWYTIALIAWLPVSLVVGLVAGQMFKRAREPRAFFPSAPEEDGSPQPSRAALRLVAK